MTFSEFFKKLMNSLFGNHSVTTTSTTTDTTTTKLGEKKKKALCLGINDYPGTANDLNGCVNDAKAWSEYLRGRGFEVEVLLDSQCKKATVINKLKQLATEAQSGLISKIVWTDSSHGTSIPDTNGDEPDGRDEAICLYDGNFVDDEIRAIINTIPPEVDFVLVSDSCHSGTVTRDYIRTMARTNAPKARYMPPENNKFAARVMGLGRVNKVFSPKAEKREVLLAGCKADEYSYDANFNGVPSGAFTHCALKVLEQNASCTYSEFYNKLAAYLPTNSYPQHPQLECSDAMKNATAF